ncbi:MAG: DMT family transporter [Rhodoferax sp.]|nr:MAG: DMT family transporter [Rhodoferax sp.]
MKSRLLALSAITLWGSLAAMSVSLRHVPPFLLTGLCLLVGSPIGLALSGFRLQAWRIPARTLALGVYGLFGYHFLLFMALRHAPPVQANLVQYLWPLGIVLMAPIFLPGTPLRALHVAAALLGFGGAALAITSGSGLGGLSAEYLVGYLSALGAAFLWSSYSLLTRRVAHFPSSAIGLFGLVSGLLALLCHVLLEPAVALGLRDWGLIAALGLGPLGAAFYLWDAALKTGDARQIGVLSFITPLLSTSILLAANGQTPDLTIVLSATLIMGAAVLGTLAK